MASHGDLGGLFVEAARDDGRVAINGRCWLECHDEMRALVVSGVPMLPYRVGDQAAEAYAIVSLVEQGWASQIQVARAFGCTARTVRRQQRRFEVGGLAALGRPGGYPRGRSRLAADRLAQVNAWKGDGVSTREIARRLKVTDKAVRKLLGRLGWRAEKAEQLQLFQSADPNLSAVLAHGAGEACVTRAPGAEAAQEAVAGADPNLSAVLASGSSEAAPSFDHDPANRFADRVMACLGLLDDAAPMFRSGRQVAGAGVLLAIPAIVESGLFTSAQELYGSIGPAFYGLRSTLLTFVLMALLRIKRPEGLKERSPAELGRLIGLDRAPEVKTARRKLDRMAALGRAADLGRALARRRVESRGHAMGFLYVDGHVRVYHGQRRLPKTHAARMRLAMPATTDYWVNDAEGEPLFVVNTEANPGLTKVLPGVLDEVRKLVGDRRVTIVFDRGGFSPKLFKQLSAAGFDILTYRKGRFRKVSTRRFSMHRATIEGRAVEYNLAEQMVAVGKHTLRMRQVTRLSADGHQTPVLTTRTDLPAIEVAYRMFGRWQQENFFKYLREEFALDALVDYSTEPADPTREVPNPARKQLDAELVKAREALGQLLTTYGVEALTNPEGLRPTMRGFKIANASIAERVQNAVQRVAKLEQRRAATPSRVPVQEVTRGEVIKLRAEAKLLTDLLKMVAYQAEGDLVRLLAPHYHRADDEGRTLVQNALANTGDICATDTELRIALEPLSAPHRTLALANLCDQLNETATIFPGSKLRLRYEMKPPPPVSLAFPGPKPCKASPATQPDISARG